MQESVNTSGHNGVVGREKMSVVPDGMKRGGGASDSPKVSQVAEASKPTMLMLSHCVPDAMGETAAARAWQLLKLSSRTHRVFVACIQDSQVNLAQWRAISAAAAGLRIEARIVQAELLGSGLRLFNAPLADRLQIEPAIRPAIDHWGHQDGFDAVLMTHPALMSIAESVDTRYVVCDMGVPASLQHLRASHRRLFSQWHRNQSRQYQRFEREVAQRCDVLTVSRYEDRRRYRDGQCKTILLPDAVDLNYFQSGMIDLVGQKDVNRLVLHTEWGQSDSKSIRDWFTRNVWPSVQKAVPNAQLATSGSKNTSSNLKQLSAASVVVSPVTDAWSTRRPVLQGMALARPVVAPLDAARMIGARHGEHVLVTRREKDWVDHCVSALRSVAMRVQLARGARSFVESHCPLEQTGRALVDTLREHAFGPESLAQAA